MKHILLNQAFAASIAAMAAVVALPALAQATCSPLTLVSSGETRSVEYIDIGAEGGSIADKRIGVRGLAAEDGSPSGQLRWVLTVVKPYSEDGGASFVEGVFALPDGHIFIRGFLGIGNAPADTAIQSYDQPGQFAVIGGTGAYAGARGISSSTFDGMKETYHLEITCD